MFWEPSPPISELFSAIPHLSELQMSGLGFSIQELSNAGVCLPKVTALGLYGYPRHLEFRLIWKVFPNVEILSMDDDYLTWDANTSSLDMLHLKTLRYDAWDWSGAIVECKRRRLYDILPKCQLPLTITE